MPGPIAIWAGVTPWWAASACFRSWFSGSPYIQAPCAAACIAATALGEGPKRDSLAPSRARKGWPLRRSSVSGPVKGTVEGRLWAWGVRKRLMGERLA